jgi:hypothetical protein
MKFAIEFDRRSFVTVWVEADSIEAAEVEAWKQLEEDHYTKDAAWEISSIEVEE